MTSSRNLTRVLALLPLALLVAASAGATCLVQYGDLDGNGSNDLEVRGSTGSQHLIIDLYQTQTVVSLDCDGVGGFNQPEHGDLDHVSFGPAELIRIRVINNVIVHFAGDLTGARRFIEVQGGSARSSYTFGSTPSPDGTLPGAPDPGKLLANTILGVQVRGKNGGDFINFTMPSVVDNSAINVRAEGGDGNDHLNLISAGLLSGGSVAEFTLNGDGGLANAYLLDQSGIIDNATLSVIFGGGPNIDWATFNLSGQIAAGGRLNLRADLGAGNDKFTGNVDMGNFSILAGGEAHLHINGGGATDLLSLSRNATVATPANILAGLLDVVMQGGPGSDQMTVDLGGGGFLTTGTLRLRVDGESGNDKINVTTDAQAGSTPNFDVIVWGGAGLDTLNVTANNAGVSAAANYGPAQAILVDAGTYSQDVCIIAGTVAPAFVHKRNCEF